ncbi:hypothetical protein CEUSTIGMA_g13353.t1 [Chlamydomonas eustigma]|uniref:Uncharacterized protein n=1 Tax=Chlamydomonas eustigma TaxID=1157962 RepID=A0A250XS73_9CHLO|nr:hypothetical protein CEUSTIGMA_g13353.t1 [Chlamydomonas eustigma]|eukprot:GAX85937.1 hypothetical protein CEUSTIGMA_g13353.t1 [Chlamydomonas eustigma]
MAQSASGVRQFNGKQSLPEKSQFLSTGDLEIPQDMASSNPRCISSALLPSVSSSSKLVNNGSKSALELKSDKVESLNSLPVIKSPLPDFRRCPSSDKGFIPTVRSLSTSGYNDSFLGALSAHSRSSVSLSSSRMSMSLGGSPLTPHTPLKPSNLSRIGPGGLPQSRERTYYRPREKEILDMANTLGMTPSRGSKRESVRISSPRRSFQLSSLSTIGRNSQAATSVNNSTSSQKGVRLSEVLRFAESLHDEGITTFNVAKKDDKCTDVKAAMPVR